jgi:hypothetical protein
VISVTTDGINYSECEETFKIYSNNIYLSSVAPKAVSVNGGAELTLDIDIDAGTAKSLFHMLIGFQPRNKMGSSQANRKDGGPQMAKNHNLDDTRNEEEKDSKQKSLNASHQSSMKGSMINIPASNDGGHINPMDLNMTDPQLDCENWV